ncbi:hypothetical protein CEXT_218901 [Caerostris extrusa]|uniref:Uncharacterized protein n=1 Tax=Caerostris extrusa TaxID=172846 RepID=A0AAV4T5G5_CAEEX|nr:hypothetical protein CEXT_218901 [Caerostris extrusa]
MCLDFITARNSPVNRIEVPEIREHLLEEWAKFTLPTKLADRSDENDSVHSTTSKSFGAIPKERVAKRVRPRTPPLVRPLKKELLFSSQITSKWNQQHRNKYLLKSNFKLTFLFVERKDITLSFL